MKLCADGWRCKGKSTENVVKLMSLEANWLLKILLKSVGNRQLSFP